MIKKLFLVTALLLPAFANVGNPSVDLPVQFVPASLGDGAVTEGSSTGSLTARALTSAADGLQSAIITAFQSGRWLEFPNMLKKFFAMAALLVPGFAYAGSPGADASIQLGGANIGNGCCSVFSWACSSEGCPGS
jgi:hypothetical protein